MTKVFITPGDAQATAAEQAALRQHPAQVPAFGVTTGNFNRVVLSSGGAAEPPVNEREIKRTNYVVVNQHDPNRVTIGGIETSREVAIKNGWIDGDQRGANFTEAGEAQPEQHQQDEQQEQTEPQPEASPVETDGNKALDALTLDFEGDAFAVANEAAVSGDFTAIAQAYGLDQAKVDLVVAGATARADRVIAETGVDTGIMSEVLDANDLADARRAVVTGQDEHLRGIAAKAVNRLTSWPSRDPQGFRTWFEQNVDAKFEAGANGQFLVETSQGWMPFASVVRLGGLKRN